MNTLPLSPARIPRRFESAFFQLTGPRRIVVAVVALIGASLPLVAQVTPSRPITTKEEDEAVTLSAFVVSAENDKGWMSQQTAIGTRYAKNLSEIPSSVAILNYEMIQDLNASEISQVLKYGGSGVAQNSGYTDDNVIRGFRMGDTMRDGATKRSFKTNPMYDVERVEIIKGPSAMLQGNNDFLGGGINYVTRQPTDKLAASASLSVGKHDYFRGSANVSGPLLNSEDLTLLYRVTVGGAHGGTEKEVETIDQSFIGGALTLRLGKEKASIVRFNIYRFVDNDYRYLNDFLDITSPRRAKLHPRSIGFSPSKRSDVYFDGVDLTTNLEFLTKLASNTNLRFFASRAESDGKARFIRGLTVAADNFTLNRQDIPIYFIDRRDAFQVDVLHRLEKRGFTNDFSVGADFTHRRNQAGQVVVNPGTLDVRNPVYPPVATPQPAYNSNGTDTYLESLSYYFQDAIKFWHDRIIVSAGMRWFDTSSHGTNPFTLVKSSTTNPRFPTHKYGLVVKPFSWMSLYYTDAENLFPQSGFTNAEPPVERLDQEGKLTEFGMKVNHKLSDKLSFYGSIVHFELMQTNVLTPHPQAQLNSAGIIIQVQSERDTVDGWEVDYGMRHELTNGHFDLLLTYYKAKTRRALDKGPILNAPGEVYSALLKYSWTGGRLKGAMVGGGLYDRDASRSGADFIVDFPVTYSLFTRYRLNDHWSVQLNLDNVTEERYLITVSNSGLATAGRPFEAFLKTNYNW